MRRPPERRARRRGARAVAGVRHRSAPAGARARGRVASGRDAAPSAPRTRHPSNAAADAPLETLIERRGALLTSLALIYADEGRRLDPDPLARPDDRDGADTFEARASAAEAELEEIENRLADASAAGLRPRRWRRR